MLYIYIIYYIYKCIWSVIYGHITVVSWVFVGFPKGMVEYLPNTCELMTPNLLVGKYLAGERVHNIPSQPIFEKMFFLFPWWDTPPKFNTSPQKSDRNPIGKYHLPTTIFRGKLTEKNFGGVALSVPWRVPV